MAVLHLAPTLLPLLPVGFLGLGMASWLDGDEEEPAASEEDEDFGMEDDFEVDDFDDDFGGMDEMEGGEASTTELENRIEDLENEIANVSSTANTVRSENEQISEKVDEVEENVRKLLEIYEMVTRGVNPFVDEVSGDMGMGGGQGDGFGLFDDEGGEEAEPEEEDLDDDLASAEAEDFFDDDAFDEIDEEGDLEGEEFEDDMDDFDMDEEESDEEESGGGTSFEELKEEYESGDADWAEEEMEEGEEIEDEEDIGFEDEDAEEGEEEEDIGFEDEDAEEDEELFEEDDLLEEDETEEEDTMEEPEQTADDAEDMATGDVAGASETVGGFQFGAAPTEDEGPYITSPPAGYLADVVVMEWMDFLLSEFDARNTVRAINYYQRIGWIGDEMRDHLLQILMGLSDSDYIYRDEFGTTELTMADHRKSLEYIEELSSGNLHRQIADRLDTLSR